jgi:hypothetical protein
MNENEDRSITQISEAERRISVSEVVLIKWNEQKPYEVLHARFGELPKKAKILAKSP